MPVTRSIQRALNGGEITPELHARPDLDKNKAGLKRVRNMFPTVTGTLLRRSGTRFFTESRGSLNTVPVTPRLIPLNVSASIQFMSEVTLAARDPTDGGTSTFGRIRFYDPNTGFAALAESLSITGVTHNATFSDVFTSARTAAVYQRDFQYNDEGKWVSMAGLNGALGALWNNQVFYVISSDPVAGYIRIASVDQIAAWNGGSLPAWTSGGGVSVYADNTFQWDSAVAPFVPGLVQHAKRSAVLSVGHSGASGAQVQEYHLFNATPTATQFYYNKALATGPGAGSIGFSSNLGGAGTFVSFASAAVVTATLRAGSPAATGLQTDYAFVVTAVHNVTQEESWQSSFSGAVTYNLTLPSTAAIDVAWTPAGTSLQELFHVGSPANPSAGAINRYRVYRVVNGTTGLVGEVTGQLTFSFEGQTPDFTRQVPRLPVFQNLALSKVHSIWQYGESLQGGGIPAFWGQRQVRSGGTRAPESTQVHMSRPGLPYNFNKYFPTRPDDAILMRINLSGNARILKTFPLGDDFIVLTDESEIRLTTLNSDAISPTTLEPKLISTIGANALGGVAQANQAAFYAAARGGRIRRLRNQNGVYTNEDMCLYSSHLFDGFTILDVAFCAAPIPMLYALRSDGKLLSMTYVEEQNVAAWALHDVGGTIISIASLREPTSDVLWLAVRRTISNRNRTFIERLVTPLPGTTDAFDDACMLDCATRYTFATPTTAIPAGPLTSGNVYVTNNRRVFGPFNAALSIVLDEAITGVAWVGLGYAAEAVTMPQLIEGAPAAAQTASKSVLRAFLRVRNAHGIYVGPDNGDDNALRYLPQRKAAVFGAPDEPLNGEHELGLEPDWLIDGGVRISLPDPLPAELLAIGGDINVGG